MCALHFEICCAGQSCLLQGYRVLQQLEDTSAFKGNKVFVLLNAPIKSYEMHLTFDNLCAGCGFACSVVFICGHMHVRIFSLEVQWKVVNDIFMYGIGFHFYSFGIGAATAGSDSYCLSRRCPIINRRHWKSVVCDKKQQDYGQWNGRQCYVPTSIRTPPGDGLNCTVVKDGSD